MSTVEYDPEGGTGEEPELESGTVRKGATSADAKARSSGRPMQVASVPLQKRGAIYTMMAHQAVNVAELLNVGLAKKTIGKKEPRKLEVSDPHGPSTSGGKRARQAITLIAVSGEGGVIMCGWLDVAQRIAELRSHAEVALQYKKRFGTSFEASAEEYDSLMKDLTYMLSTMGIRRVEAADSDEEASSTAPSSALSAGSGARWLVAGVLALLALGALLLSR